MVGWYGRGKQGVARRPRGTSTSEAARRAGTTADSPTTQAIGVLQCVPEKEFNHQLSYLKKRNGNPLLTLMNLVVNFYV